MNINWKVRFKNKAFWIFIIPAILLLIESVASLFGFTIDLAEVGDKMIEVVKALFVVLAGVGIVTDPTTVGLSDSYRALGYEEPNADIEYEEIDYEEEEF